MPDEVKAPVVDAPSPDKAAPKPPDAKPAPKPPVAGKGDRTSPDGKIRVRTN